MCGFPDIPGQLIALKDLDIATLSNSKPAGSKTCLFNTDHSSLQLGRTVVQDWAFSNQNYDCLCSVRCYPHRRADQ